MTTPDPSPSSAGLTLDVVAERFERLRAEIHKVIIGQEALVEGVLVALVAQGSVLLEGAPGLGKTLLVNVLSRTVSCDFKRIQFTPDLMPSDLTGHNVFDMREQEFHFQPGPVFTNLLLTDEINRSPPKTQSALLEVMQEHQVTVDGRTYPLSGPFLVLATQNQLEHEGTYPLPEAQVDRFMFKLLIDYPSAREESAILAHYAEGRSDRDLSGFDLTPILTKEEVVAVQRLAATVIVEPAVIDYMTAIVTRTRDWHTVSVGASPRGSVNLLMATRALAACRGRDFVTPDDVKEVAPWVLRHRLILRSEAEIEGETADAVVERILAAVAPPLVLIPSTRLLVLYGLSAIPIVGGLWVPSLTLFGLLANGLVALVAIIDLVRTPRDDRIDIVRETTRVLSVGTENPVTLSFLSRLSSPLEIEVFDEAPPQSRTDGLPLRIELVPRRVARATYHVRPHRRGRAQFAAVHLRYASPLRMWRRVTKRRLVDEVRVYPDIRSVRQFDLLAKHNRVSEMGLKLWTLRGREGEFERLREYRIEDEMRHIDWRATAKHQKLISREFTVERNQNVVVLLDCGVSMLNETDGVSHLDQALNATIILSYIALRQGDNVSMIAFSNRIERRVGPIRGKAAVQALIQQTYDLEPRPEASDYGLVCEELMRQHKKRALVLLLTYALDDQHLDAISRYVKRALASHLFLCVLLKDLPLLELAKRVPKDDVEAFQIAAAAEMLTAQARRLEALRASGVHAVEVVPNELASKVVNRYLDAKARHLL